MRLLQLLDQANIPDAHILGDDNHDVEITHIAENSRVSQPGTLFVAVKGSVHDGHKYIGDALGRAVKAARIV